MQKSGEIIKQERNSSIELLRILIMLMIVGCHFATHGGFSFDNHTISIPRLWWYMLEMGGNLGVDVFIIISGYFLIENRNLGFNFKKIFKLYGQLFFYSIVLFIFSFAIGRGTLAPSTIIKTLLPVSFSQWWFASTYFVMFLLHPYLNRLLLSLDKRQYQTFIVFLFIIWSIIPTLTTSAFQSNALIEFLMYYSIAGYIKIYGLNPSLKSRHWFILWLSFSLLAYISCAVFIILGTRYEVFATYSLHFFDRQSVLTIFMAICFFMAFATWKIKYNRLINTISSATFGVYLLHDSIVLRPYLWKEVFKNASYQNTPLLIPYSIIVVLVVYIACTIIDLGRKHLLEKPYLKLVNAYSDQWLLPFEKVIDRVKSIVFGRKT